MLADVLVPSVAKLSAGTMVSRKLDMVPSEFIDYQYATHSGPRNQVAPR